MSTAVWPLQDAIDDVLTNDGTYAAKIGARSYLEETKPENATLPFQSYGLSTERAWDRFNSAGNDGTLVIHLYGDDKEVVAGMYADVERLLNNQPITVTGHGVLLLRTTLLSLTPDPVRRANGTSASHGVVSVRALTRAT